MAVERKLKGINFIGTLDAFTREYGVDRRARLVESLDGELGEAVRLGTILASAWFPASWYAALLTAIVDEVGGGTRTVHRLAKEAVAADFRTLFKIVRLFLTPQKALQQSMRVSSRYIDGGKIEVVEARDGLYHARLSEYYGYSRLMWWDFVGGVEAVLEGIGAENLTPKILSGGADGDHHLEFVMRWR